MGQMFNALFFEPYFMLKCIALHGLRVKPADEIIPHTSPEFAITVLKFSSAKAGIRSKDFSGCVKGHKAIRRVRGILMAISQHRKPKQGCIVLIANNAHDHQPPTMFFGIYP
jgi:hypothetical protein